MKFPDVLCLYSVILNGQPLWEYYSFLQKGRNEYFTFSDIIYMLLCQVIFLNHVFWDLCLQHPLPCFCMPVCAHTHTHPCSAFRALENSCIFKNYFFLSLSCVLLSSLKLLNISESQLIEDFGFDRGSEENLYYKKKKKHTQQTFSNFKKTVANEIQTSMTDFLLWGVGLSRNARIPSHHFLCSWVKEDIVSMPESLRPSELTAKGLQFCISVLKPFGAEVTFRKFCRFLPAETLKGKVTLDTRLQKCSLRIEKLTFFSTSSLSFQTASWDKRK